jgi:hypothetical protein
MTLSFDHKEHKGHKGRKGSMAFSFVSFVLFVVNKKRTNSLLIPRFTTLTVTSTTDQTTSASVLLAR